MWALRRASLPLRNRGFNVRASCIKSVSATWVEDDSGTLESSRMAYSRLLLPNMFYHSGHASLKFTVSRRELSSQADASSTKDQDDLEDGFSELETPASESGKDEFNDIKDGEEPHGELEFSDTEVEPSEKKGGRRAQSEIFKLIDRSPSTSVHVLMDRWVKEGKELSRQDISLAMVNLRRRKLYLKAFQLSEWIASKSQLEVTERDHATRVDLIAKLRGLHEAEMYVQSIPESFKGETVYQTLLGSCVAQNNLKKAEATFNKIKDLKSPPTSFAWNQMLLLYKKHDKKKIPDVLLMMENENVKFSPYTYKILIDAKGQSKDIDEMDIIVETMKAEGIEPDMPTNAVLVGHYISAGYKEKAEDLLKKMEGENLKENSWLGRYLLPLYANLGNADEVGRIWEVCQASPQMEVCLAAIEAFGKLKKIDEAEAVFEMVSRRWKLSFKSYSVLLEVYANNKMLAEGYALIREMADSGCQIDSEIFKPIDCSPSTSQLSEWVELKRQQLELGGGDYPKWGGPIVDLLELHKAKMYIQSIPEFFKGETMKAEGIEPDIRKNALLVCYYISAGLKRKAEDLLKKMEGENLKENSWLGRYLLPLYANLGKADEVGRIWEVCQASPQMEECLAAIEAFGKLEKIDEADAVFEMMSRRWKLSSKNYSVMLEVYVNNKMLPKGNDLVNQMANSGCQIEPEIFKPIDSSPSTSQVIGSNYYLLPINGALKGLC